MLDDNAGVRKRTKRMSRMRRTLNISQERGSYYFYIGLLLITIFSCVASGAPVQGFYGIIFVAAGILIALFPPAFLTSKWLVMGSGLFLISLSMAFLPRSFAGKQEWRINLENLGFQTGNLITPNPASTIESLIIIGVVLVIGLTSLGHRLKRDKLLKIANLFVLFIGIYVGISMLYMENNWKWSWNPNDSFGFFSNTNHMATLMVMASLVGVGTIFINIKNRKWISCLITTIIIGIICWGVLGYSISRAGLILFILFQFLWFVFAGRGQLNYKFISSFIVLFILSIILFFISDTELENRFERFFSEQNPPSNLLNEGEKEIYASSLGLRKFIHLDTYKMIGSEPWTGTGLESYEFIFPYYKNKSLAYSSRVSNSTVLHPESNWLDLTLQGGIASTVILLFCIFLAVIFSILRNKKSRSWLLCFACILAIFCVLTHGIFDVPGQKIGIALSSIFLLGITFKPIPKDKIITIPVTIFYQLIAVGIFTLGTVLIYSEWFNLQSVIFANSESQIKKIEKLYQMSIEAATEQKIDDQKQYLLSAIELSNKAISKTPLNPTLHFMRGKLYSQLSGEDDKMLESFAIESALDPSWIDLPLRQSKVWLFIDIYQTRVLWSDALNRADLLSKDALKSTWNKILVQANRHPLQIRDVYKIIIERNEPYFIKLWMDYAGEKNFVNQMPLILSNPNITEKSKSELLDHWKQRSRKTYQDYQNSKVKI